MTRVCIVIRDNGGGAPAFEEACARVCTHVCVCVCMRVSFSSLLFYRQHDGDGTRGIKKGEEGEK